MVILQQGFFGLVGNLIFMALLVMAIFAIVISINEKENRAALRLGLFLLGILIVSVAINIFSLKLSMNFLWPVFSGITVAGLFMLFIPWPEKKLERDFSKEKQIDERTIMFSRAELEPETKKYSEYYNRHPEHKEADDAWRKSPGLLSTHSQFYHPFLFPAADATFYTVSGLHAKTDGPVNSNQVSVDQGSLTKFLSNWAMKMGCHSIGITELQTSHLYSIGGRKHNYGEPVSNQHRLAIAFTVEMNFDRVASAPRGPIIMESANQYLNAGIIAVQLAAFLRNMGFSAKAHIDGKYQVRCPQVARDAGLGELGRMGLLMTPKLGPRVRIGVVTTDAPLETTKKISDSSVIRFCKICKKCADTCPSQAISFDDRMLTNGALQWNINQERCFSYWCKVGTDCGRCVSTCPYSHPDNIMHNMVRFFIRVSPVFRRLAYKLDDVLYGRKPPSREIPDWMKAKN